MPISYEVTFEMRSGLKVPVTATLSASQIEFCKHNERGGCGPGVPGGPCERGQALESAWKSLTSEQRAQVVIASLPEIHPVREQ